MELNISFIDVKNFRISSPNPQKKKLQHKEEKGLVFTTLPYYKNQM